MPDPSLLSGYRVLDLSQYIPGPFATRALADLGAEVLKIEPPGGDPMRRLSPSDQRDSLSPLYRHLNRGKRVAILDLKRADGQASLAELLADADVLLESYRPGVLARLGFSRERLAAINPRLVHCALSGFGQTGPYRARAGHDLTYCAVSGALSACGIADRPVMAFAPIADHAGAMQAVNAILAALLGRARSGKGAFLDISLSESLLAWQYPALFEARHGENPGRDALLLNGGAACYNIYRTLDGRFVALAALEDKFWRLFCGRVGMEEWIGRHHEPLPQRRLIAELQALFGGQPLDHWQRLLSAVDCCFEPIPLLNEVTSHPQIQARALVTGFQPGYPAWIDDRAVKTDREMILLEPHQIARWKTGPGDISTSDR